MELSLALLPPLADARELEIPPAPLLDQAVRAPAQVVGGSELADAGERGAVGQDRPGGEGLDEAESIEVATGLRVAEQRLRLGGEAEVTAELGQEERTDAETISGEEQLLLAAVPDGEREVSVQPVQAVDPPFLVRVREHLGVGGGLEPMPERPELSLQLHVVVDLAVLHDPVAPILVRERLVSPGDVDDRQPRVRHPEAPVDVEPRPVGSTVTELPGHGQKQARRGVPAWARVDPRETAHELCSKLRSLRRPPQDEV